MWYTHT